MLAPEARAGQGDAAGTSGPYGGGVEGWTDFFVAVAGAAAALAGLIIVAVSVNVAHILEYPQLPTRAAAAIASLMTALLVAVTGLVPQPVLAFGVEAAALGVLSWIVQTRSAVVVVRANRAASRPIVEALQVVLLGQLQTLPLVVGGALVAAGIAAGPFVLLGGIVAIFAFTMLEAWVLLIEILR